MLYTDILKKMKHRPQNHSAKLYQNTGSASPATSSKVFWPDSLHFNILILESTCLFLKKKTFGDFDERCAKSIDQLGEDCNLKVLVLPIYAHGLSISLGLL